MGEFSIWHWLVVLLVVLLLFGGGKVSGLMGDLASGIKAFKKVMSDDAPPQRAADAAPAQPAESISGPAGEAPPSPAARRPEAAPREATLAH